MRPLPAAARSPLPHPRAGGPTSGAGLPRRIRKWLSGRRYRVMHDLTTGPPTGRRRLSGDAPMTALTQQAAALLRRRFAPSLVAGAVVLVAATLLVIGTRAATLGLGGLLIAVTAAMMHLHRRLAASQAFDARIVGAIDCLDHGFGMFDAEDRLVLCNRRYREIYRRNGADADSRMAETGMTLRELIQLRIENGLNVVPPGQSAERYIAERIDGIRSARHHVWRTADGRWFAITCAPVPDGGWVTVWTDITQIKRAEEERRSLEMQLHNAQKLEAVGTLAGGMAHDLNNAMVPLLALTKLAVAAMPEGSRERRRLELVHKGAERAREVAAQMLAFSREEKVETAPVDFPAVLREAMELLRASLPATIRLETRISPVPSIVANAGQLSQVIVNLVTNASQAIGTAMGVIDVSLEPSAPPAAAVGAKGGNWVRLAVVDTGCGMDEATRRRIFEPFFTTKQVGQGTGLGLSVVHGIVSAHGGTIEVSSRPGDGTRFDILLPAA
jgi:signal transduction histidine kinase